MSLLRFKDRTVHVSVFAKTDVGRTRDHNEDAYLVADLTPPNPTLSPKVREHTVGAKGSILVVADGMGGATAGEMASQLATQTVFRRLVEDWVPDRRADAQSFEASLTHAILAANGAVYQRSKEDPGLEGMGTTMTAVGLLGDQIIFAQVGDSRAYLIRDGRVEQVTEDQSLLQRLVEEGQMTEEDAQNSPGKNIILQALGPTPEVEVVLSREKARRGDALVLCSDGLSGVVQAQEILEAVDRSQDPAVTCEDLVELANSRGGPDNITVIVARLDGPGLKEPRGAA